MRVCASLLTEDTFWDSFENKDAFSIDTVICSRLTATEPLPPSSSLLLLLLFVPLFPSSEACLTWNILIENRYPRISVRIVSLPSSLYTHTHTHTHTNTHKHRHITLWLDQSDKTHSVTQRSLKNKKNRAGNKTAHLKAVVILRQLGFGRLFGRAAVNQACAREQLAGIPTIRGEPGERELGWNGLSM